MSPDTAGREMTVREHLEQITKLLAWVAQPSKLMDVRNHAYMALKKIDGTSNVAPDPQPWCCELAPHGNEHPCGRHVEAASDA